MSAKLSSRLLTFSFLIFITTALAGDAQPSQRWVVRPRVDLLAGNSLCYPVVATMKRGDVVQVLGSDEKRWLSVRYQDKTGFVHEKAMSLTMVSADSKSLADIMPEGESSVRVTQAAAAKGLEPETVLYAQAHKYDTKPLEELRRRRAAISAQELSAFQSQVKPAAK